VTYVKLDDRSPWRPVILGLSDAAWRVHFTAMCHCSEHLTDGAITEPALRAFHPRAAKAAAELVEVGLWERTDTGWRIPGYLDDQRSAAEVERIKEQKRKAGRKGGEAKAAAKHGASRMPSELPADDNDQLPTEGSTAPDDHHPLSQLGSSSKFWPIFAEAGQVAARCRVPAPKNPDAFATKVAQTMQREQEWQLPELLELRPDLEANPSALAYILATDGAGAAIEKAKEFRLDDLDDLEITFAPSGLDEFAEEGKRA